MASNVIFLSDVLKAMSTLDENGKAVPFSISFRTMNRFSKKGGKLLTFDKAVLVMKENNDTHPTINTLRFSPNIPKAPKKNPNHWQNKTRNIRVPERPRPIKLHINNIITFNTKEVVY